MMRCFSRSLGAVWLALAIGLAAEAQTTFAPPAQQTQSGTVPYGGRPLLQVAPDGAVHLDGPLAGQSMPRAIGQPVAVGQPQLGVVLHPGVVQQPSVGVFGNYATNNTIRPQYEHRHSVWGEFLYIRPRNAEVAYALPIDGPVAPVLGNEVVMGPVAVVDFDFEPAFRAGVNVRLHEDSSIALQYSHLRASASDTAVAIAPLELRSLASHPLGVNAATDVDAANATHDIEYDLIDGDFRALVDGCELCEEQCAHAINVILGGRYVQFDQRFRSNFVTLTTTSVDTNIDFNGGGIRLGVEGERHGTRRGFFVYGRGITNLMVGEFKADYRQTHTLGGIEAFTDYQVGRVVPAVDLEVGLGWVAPRHRLRLSAGYMTSWWFNVVKTEDFIRAVQSGNFDDPSGTLTFDGLTARAEWQF